MTMTTNKISNEELIVEIVKSKEAGETTERLTELSCGLVERQLGLKGFNDHPLKEDMIQQALCDIIRLYPKIKPERSDNAFAYLTQITSGSFLSVICKERKEQMEAKYGH